MPESAGAHVDIHVHPHTSELTKEELEAKRQAAAAQEEEDERGKNEEGRTPVSIRENAGRLSLRTRLRRFLKKQS